MLEVLLAAALASGMLAAWDIPAGVQLSAVVADAMVLDAREEH